MNDSLIRGLAIGVIATVGVVIFGPSAAQAARPVVRRVMKSAVQTFVRGQEAVAEFVEMAEDAYAEAWTELKEEADQKVAPTPSKTDDTPKGETSEVRVGRKKRAR
jgi:hypothetical protein